MVIDAKEALCISIENTDDGLGVAMNEIAFRARQGARTAIIQRNALDPSVIPNLLALGYGAWTDNEGWVNITW